MNNVLLKYPLWISWELTASCNYSCIHCRMEDKEYPKLCNKELTTDEAKHCIDEFASLGIYKLGISGGEPFLRPDLFELLEYMSDKNIKIVITSNGSLIDYNVVLKLKKLKNLESVQISLDGKDDETHDYIRQKTGAFNRAVSAIKLLASEGIRTGVVTTVMKPNINQVSDIIKLIQKLGVQVYGARRFMPVGHGSKSMSNLLVTKEEYRKHLLFWENLQNSNDGIQYTIEEPLLGCVSHNNTQSYTCPAGNSYGALSAIGDVRACIFLPISLGNIKEQSFSAIWTGSQIRNQIFQGCEMCRGCKFEHTCAGCRTAAYAITENMHGKDPLCFV